MKNLRFRNAPQWKLHIWAFPDIALDEDIRLGIPRKYGFHTNIKTKPMIISSLINTVRDQLYTERDENCLDELLTYERKANGAFGAIIGRHDDILMTRAIGLHICFYEMDLPRIIPHTGTNRKIRKVSFPQFFLAVNERCSMKKIANFTKVFKSIDSLL